MQRLHLPNSQEDAIRLAAEGTLGGETKGEAQVRRDLTDGERCLQQAGKIALLQAPKRPQKIGKVGASTHSSIKSV